MKPRTCYILLSAQVLVTGLGTGAIPPSPAASLTVYGSEVDSFGLETSPAPPDLPGQAFYTFNLNAFCPRAYPVFPILPRVLPEGVRARVAAVAAYPEEPVAGQSVP